MASQLLWFVGNRNPSITQTITVNGAPVDLTSATVTFSMRPVGSSTAKVNAQSATIVGAPTNGNVRYDWQAADVDTAGQYLCWWTVTISAKTQDVAEAVIEFRSHTAVQLYIELEQVKSTFELTGTTFTDQDVKAAVNAACRAIDDVCDRRFYLDADANQVRYYTAKTYDWLEIDDLVAITSLQVDLDGTGGFAQSWTQNSDYYLAPFNAPSWGRPYTQIRWNPVGRYLFIPWLERNVKVTGQFGWPTVPAPVSDAATMLVGRLFKRKREAPLGVIAGMDMVATRILR